MSKNDRAPWNEREKLPQIEIEITKNDRNGEMNTLRRDGKREKERL